MSTKPETAAEELAESIKTAIAHEKESGEFSRSDVLLLLSSAQDAVDALSAQGEAVAWQCRRRNTVTGEWMEWLPCDSELERDYAAQGSAGAAYEFRSLYAATPAATPAKPITRENEASLMLSIAEFIAASATPEDPRRAVADAISRHLGLGWPSTSGHAAARVTDAECVEIYNAVSAANILRDVKSTDHKIAIVRGALEADHGK